MPGTPGKPGTYTGRTRGKKPGRIRGRTRGLTGGEPGGRCADLPGDNPGITANRRNNKNFGEIVGPPGEGVKPFQITWPIYALTVTCSEGHPSHPGGHALLPGRPPSAGSFQPEALTALPVPPYPRGGGRGGRPGSRASAPGVPPGSSTPRRPSTGSPTVSGPALP